MIFSQIVSGLTEGAIFFLMAAGLTLVLGLTRIVNFAHGSFYMLGAFVGRDIYAFVGPTSLTGFFLSVFAAGFVVAIIGIVCERFVLRHVYGKEQLLQLLITVGFVFIFRDVVKMIWGVQSLTTPIPHALSGPVIIGDMFLPLYSSMIALFGLSAMVLMLLVIFFTRAGIILRAATDDAQMVANLGINQQVVFCAVFATGCFLAGIAGALMAPLTSINYLLDTTIIIGAFVVVVIGGLGNLYGAMIAALSIGVIKAIGVLYFPRFALVLIFLIMAAVLLIRSVMGTEQKRL